jgi:hypothetical protein
MKAKVTKEKEISMKNVSESQRGTYVSLFRDISARPVVRGKVGVARPQCRDIRRAEGNACILCCCSDRCEADGSRCGQNERSANVVDSRLAMSTSWRDRRKKKNRS